MVCLQGGRDEIGWGDVLMLGRDGGGREAVVRVGNGS